MSKSVPYVAQTPRYKGLTIHQPPLVDSLICPYSFSYIFSGLILTETNIYSCREE